MQYVQYNVCYICTMCNVQVAICSVQYSACNMQGAMFNLQCCWEVVGRVQFNLGGVGVNRAWVEEGVGLTWKQIISVPTVLTVLTI